MKNSQSHISEKTKLYFKQGAAENIPFQKAAFNKVYSIEAAQHFQSIEQFSKEVYRVLKNNGKLVFTTFFGTTPDSNDQLREKLISIRDGADTLYYVNSVIDHLKTAGFHEIEKVSIGAHVFYGWDKWFTQNSDESSSWGNYWLPVFENNQVDYYIITAKK